MAYGVTFTLYLICFYFLKSQTESKHDRRRAIILLSYISVMFAMGTIYVGTTTQATMVSYVYHSNFPGGPSFYNNVVLFSAPIGILNTISYVIANWMADGLLLWRLYVMFQGSPLRFGAIAFPGLVYLGSLAMGFMFIIQNSLPNGSLWADGEIQFALPYFVLSVSMSIIATSIMILRMLLFKRKLQSILGKSHTSPYTSVSAILVESCALYATFSIIFIVLFAINHPIQYVFLSALANVQIIATLLIIFRVSQNKAWTKQATDSTLTALRFDSDMAENNVTGKMNSSIQQINMKRFDVLDESRTRLSSNE
ncbi:hypothetical protein BDN70DRAFT_804686 [Pholiota conissans]|uniref:Uncharacterized protein n=1 Tax=Pholiota conissans TaxID=109636 RepID=A0A9P6CUN2_9AGAR|nr:hypothetical protein BDN70DRAFT_804686 [Pholiota conissans]